MADAFLLDVDTFGLAASSCLMLHSLRRNRVKGLLLFQKARCFSNGSEVSAAALLEPPLLNNWKAVDEGTASNPAEFVKFMASTAPHSTWRFGQV